MCSTARVASTAAQATATSRAGDIHQGSQLLVTKGPPVVAALALPVLPADVLRAIWQAKWRAEAACVVQQAWRAGAESRHRKFITRYVLRAYGLSTSALGYVMKYVTKG